MTQASPPAHRAPRRLRVSYVWDDTVLGDAVVKGQRTVTVGPHRRATFVTPELGLPGKFKILRPSRRGFVLTLAEGMSGSAEIGGESIEVADYLASADASGGFRATTVRPGDWGVIHLDDAGAHILLFHFADGGPAIGRPQWQDMELFWPSLAFAAVLLGLIVAATLPLRSDHHSYVFPGDREFVADYLVNRREPTPRVAAAATRAGTETGTAEKVAAAAGDRGKAGGRGEQPRRRSPRPERTPPSRQIPDEIKRGLLTDDSRSTISQVVDTSEIDARLDMATANIEEPSRSGGAGRGGGAGDGEGFGNTRGSDDRGRGGGGSAHGETVSRGDIDTGGTRAARGSAGGGNVKEVAVKVRIGRPSGDLGSLTEEEINRVVKSRKNAIRACYERQLQRNPNLGGKIVIQWRIGPDGSVGRARVRKTSMRSGPVEDCIVRQIRRMEFPAPRGGGSALVKRYPFIFAR